LRLVEILIVVDFVSMIPSVYRTHYLAICFWEG